MAIKASTGLRTHMLDSGPLKTALDGGFIRIFSGAIPDSADDSETGTLLCIISQSSSGAGLSFAATAANGMLVKESAETWTGVNVAAGEATYYRFVGPNDTGAASVYEARIQGTVGINGSDLNLSSTALALGATQTVDYYSIALPTL